MPPWTIMHHSTPLTCCIDHTRQKRKGTKKGERKFIIKKGEPPYMTSEKVIMHTWYWLLCDKFRDLLIETLFAVKPQALCGINLRSTTVVCWQVHSPMGDPSSRVENKKRKRKKVCGVKLPQSKIWDNISSVSILKWEKSSWWRWMIFRKWRIEVCWTAPWFFNLWINSRVFGRNSENRSVDLAIRRNSPTIAE